MTKEYDLASGTDPASIGAATPETEHDPESTPVYAVGIGPGNTDYLTPRGEHVIREADVVVGFETVVEFVRDRTSAATELLVCGYADESETLDRFGSRIADGATGTAVLMGDPNHSGYQFVGKVQAAVGSPVRIIPGISSLQVAASRARTPMEETAFITLHKSGEITPALTRLCEQAGDRHLLVLPRPYDWMPGDIAETLLEAGVAESLTAIVFERLTHDDETTTRTTLGELAVYAGGSDAESTPFSDLSVLTVRADD